MNSPTLLRTTEWSSLPVRNLTIDQRRSLTAASEAWAESYGLPHPPLGFAGPDGGLLVTNHYVGVISAAGVSVEIFPKLDREAVTANGVTEPSSRIAMRQLVWMMQVAGHLELVETGIAALQEKTLRYHELFAWLLAVNLQRELAIGVAHDYFTETGDIPTVRGRINFVRQATQNCNRLDRISCRWDEYSADTVMNRVFKSASVFMAAQVATSKAERLLAHVIDTLCEVSDVSPLEALQGAATVRWSRNAERYRRVFNFAVQLLRAIGHDPVRGGTPTFTWLVDMNSVFEDFVAAAIEARFHVSVEKQKYLGKLLRLQQGGIYQYADSFWRDDKNNFWIGDAKYKSLSPDRDWSDVGLSAADVRQLTTYGGLTRTIGCRLVIFYPALVEHYSILKSKTWNDLPLFLVPVSLEERLDVGNALPADFGPLQV